jgi:UDP-glucose 4-epimerase
MKQVLITGATGFIGKHISQQLAADGFNLLLLGRSLRTLKDLKTVILEKFPAIDCMVMPCDLGNITGNLDLGKPIDRVDHIVHCASIVPGAVSGMSFDSADIKGIGSNIALGLRKLCDRCPNLNQLIHMSSASVYDQHNPSPILENSPKIQADTGYAASKYQTERECTNISEEKNCDLTILRPCQIYGPGEPHGLAVTKMIKTAIDGGTITLNNAGLDIRDLVFVNDIATVTSLALKDRVSGAINIGSGCGYSMLEVVTALQAASPHTCSLITEPESREPNGAFLSTALLQKTFPELSLTPLAQGLEKSFEHVMEIMRHAA